MGYPSEGVIMSKLGTLQNVAATLTPSTGEISRTAVIVG
jgi:hypothetical protein